MYDEIESIISNAILQAVDHRRSISLGQLVSKTAASVQGTAKHFIAMELSDSQEQFEEFKEKLREV